MQDAQKKSVIKIIWLFINRKKMLPFTSQRMISQIQECGEISLLTYNHPFPLACFLSQHLGHITCWDISFEKRFVKMKFLINFLWKSAHNRDDWLCLTFIYVRSTFTLVHNHYHTIWMFFERKAARLLAWPCSSPIQSSHQSTPYHNLGNFHCN